MSCDTLYHEIHRPQFHFTPKTMWMNDPNGLVYCRGEYHMFFQADPTSMRGSGYKVWGHAISRDLVHWEQIAEAIEVDELGTIWSGSAVVDWRNTGGFQAGNEPALVAFYTSAGAHVVPPKPFTQSIAYSNDRGRTWTKHPGNPVLGHIRAANRDPKVIWHEPTGKWVMALYLDGNDYTLYGSADLRSWQHLSDLVLPGASECPDIFELPVDGDADDTRWVFWGANGSYVVGAFDGTTLTPEGDVQCAELGANGYAAQTFSDIPAEDGRRIQVSWMRGGKYPEMPFNQQMSFPVALTLRTTPEGMRLFREPVREIERMHVRKHTWRDVALESGQRLIPETAGKLFDVRLEIEPLNADAFGIQVRGADLVYDVHEQTITFGPKQARLPLVDGVIKLQLLVDRTSLEVFGNGGLVSMSFCFLPEAADHPLEFDARGGTAQIVALDVHELKSAWPK
jgi:sucrose-6-phosphate hydrolase SacC (GH32 family)